MNIPKPVPGMVVRYSFLWSEEAKAGREEAVKDRPCAIILTTADVGEQIRTLVLPITHTPPSNADDAVEIPKAVKDHLGLDHERSWILLGELNVFAWPGYDLRPVGKSGSPAYGLLPRKFFQHVRSRFVTRRNYKITNRT